MIPSSLRRLVATSLLLLASCSDRPEVVLYVSADDHLARQVATAFEDETGVRVRMVGDTEQQKTTGLANRLRAERDNPQADVYWSSEVFQTVALAAEGVLAPYEPPSAAGWPARFADDEHRWHGFAARARVIVYAPDRVPAGERPRTWMDLAQPRFKGRIVLADPRFGTTGGHLGAMKAYWSRIAGPAYYDAFLLGLADNGVRILPGGNAGVVEAVARGEADIGLTDTDDVWAAQARGLDVDLVYPRHDLEGEPGGGTLLIPNTVATVTGGPNQAAARRLVDFLLSERVERLLAESVSHNVPVRPAIAADFERYAVPDPLAIDYESAARLAPGAVEEAMRRLGGGTRDAS